MRGMADAADPHAFGHWLFAQDVTFLRGVVKIDGLPAMTHPEIAFAGRSNVGKSSLVNALTGRRTVARVSNTPGRTKELNFFDLGGRLVLADLPGYGFAQTNRKLVDQWTKVIFSYLRGRANLRRVILLVDARHGLKTTDREAMEILDEAAVGYRIVLTKADKLNAFQLKEIAAATEAEAAKHAAAYPEISVTSSEKGTGIPELRAAIAAEAAA
jgi:GTP-binding protein